MTTQTKAKNSRLVGLAITTALATTALTGCTGKAAPSAAYSAAAAEAALAKGKPSLAIGNAEAAVLANPRDAYTRTLLANAYLEGGRFQSAATTFAEAIELGDTASRTVISYALAQIGSGDQQGALDTLVRYENALDPADFGLAVALAGRPQQGVYVLSNALRGGANSPKVRQNLAYAYALAGDWRSARLMAAEDVPADKVGDRMAEWAAMVDPAQSQTRVAALLDVRPVADSGQPAMLALANHPAVGQLAAEVATPAAPVAEAAPAETGFAFAGELPAAQPTTVAAAFADSGEASFADAGLAPVASSNGFVAGEIVQSVPAPRAARPVGIAATTRSPAAIPAPSFERVSGDYNVQLGSFASMSGAQDAWKQLQARYPELRDAERVITKARVGGKVYYRVAAAGFARASANSMCSKVKGKGGGCIAYAARSPLPGAIRGDIRVAAR